MRKKLKPTPKPMNHPQNIAPPTSVERDHSTSALQVLYLAFGYRYLVMAIYSAIGARRSGTLAHFKLITNLPVRSVRIYDEEPFDDIVVIDSSNKENRYAKIRILDFADGTASLYLDCDTVIQTPLHQFVPALSKFDVALRPHPYSTKWEFGIGQGSTSKDAAICEFNSGVFFFSRTPGAKELFRLWGKYFHEMGFDRDQPSLLKAFMEAKSTRLLPLGTGWNAIPSPNHDMEFIRERPNDVRIIHYKGGPLFWPNAGPALASIHRHCVIETFSSKTGLEQERYEFSQVARYLENPLFRYELGRRLIHWQLKRKGRPFGLRMKGERDKSRAK